MDKLSKLIEILKQNFEEYKKEILNQDIEVIFDKSYETTIKNEITEYCDFDDLSDDTIERLLAMNNPLEFLYQEYLNCDTTNIINEINVVLKELSQKSH